VVSEGQGEFRAAVLDVTDRHRADAERERLNRELQLMFAREQQFARTDALTGVNNRRYWFELAEHEFETAARYRHPLSVIMLDIDHFSLVNDRFGHAVGDQVLERVAQVARAALRSADVIGRYGGDESVIALPVTTAGQAYPVAERIRAGVAEIRVPTPKGDAAVTLSVGIAEMLLAPPAARPGGDDSVEHVIRRADEAMYAAKQAGGNRIATWSAPAERP
jgi:diguanylate cyclase (GGDEF)-like protein